MNFTACIARISYRGTVNGGHRRPYVSRKFARKLLNIPRGIRDAPRAQFAGTHLFRRITSILANFNVRATDGQARIGHILQTISPLNIRSW